MHNVGEQAKHLYENFKKRYQKKRNVLKKVDRSGTSSSVVDKAKKDLEPYLFFSWIDNYTRPRASRTNIQFEGENEEQEVDDDSEVEMDGREEYEMENAAVIEKNEQETQEIVAIESKKEKKRSAKVTDSRPKKKLQKKVNEEEENDDVAIMKSLASEIKERRSQIQPEDSEDLYGKTIANELRKFSERERYVIKHEIDDILFKHTMNRFQQPHFQQKFSRGPQLQEFQSPPYTPLASHQPSQFYDQNSPGSHNNLLHLQQSFFQRANLPDSSSPVSNS